MKFIDRQLLIAISSLKQLCGTNRETGRRLGITGKHVAQILKGEVQAIRDSNWDTMEKVLRPLLSPAADPQQDAELENALETLREESAKDLATRAMIINQAALIRRYRTGGE